MPYVNHNQIKSNCRECEKRYPGCHDHCEDYKNALKVYRDKQHFVQMENRERLSPLKYRYEVASKAWRRKYV